MGEYLNGYKIGTCSSLYYITREELESLRPASGTDPDIEFYLRLKNEYTYRFPRKNDPFYGLETCGTREAFDYLTIDVSGKLKIPHKNFAQVEMRSTCSGANDVFNLKFCPMDRSHFKEMYPTRSGGWGKAPEEIATTPIHIVGNCYTKDHPDGYTVFQCAWCEQQFMLIQDEIDEYIRPVLLDRGLEYEAGFLKAY